MLKKVVGMFKISQKYSLTKIWEGWKSLKSLKPQIFYGPEITGGSFIRTKSSYLWFKNHQKILANVENWNSYIFYLNSFVFDFKLYRFDFKSYVFDLNSYGFYFKWYVFNFQSYVLHFKWYVFDFFDFKSYV